MSSHKRSPALHSQERFNPAKQVEIQRRNRFPLCVGYQPRQPVKVLGEKQLLCGRVGRFDQQSHELELRQQMIRPVGVDPGQLKADLPIHLVEALRRIPLE